jgi:hypothetical protein
MKFSALLLAGLGMATALALPPLPAPLAIIKLSPETQALRRGFDPAAAQERVSKLEIVNSTKAKEAQAVLTGAVSRNLKLLDQTRKVQLVQVYDAATPPLKHSGNPQATPGAHSPNALVGSDDRIMLWGPYAELDKGRYLVVYRFQLLEKPKSKEVCFLDVCHDTVTFRGLRPEAKLVPVKEWSEIGVAVDVPSPMKFEYRFWPHDHLVAIDRVYVFRLE